MLIFSIFTLICYGSLTLEYNNNNNNIIYNNKNILRLGLISLLFSLIYLYLYIPLNLFNNININYINISLYNGYYIFNIINYILSYIIYIICIIFIILFSFNISNNNFINKYITLNSIEILYLVYFNLIALLYFIMVNNLISFFITLELQSYSIYLITSINNKSFNSVKSGLLYFLIGSLASSIILLGISIIYYLTGSTYFDYFTILFYYLTNSSSSIYLNPLSNNIINLIIDYNFNSINIMNNSIHFWIILFSFFLIFFGLSLKMGLAPNHNWSIYVYNNVPTIITYYISIIIKISILGFILNFLYLFINNFLIFNISISNEIYNINIYKFNIIIIFTIILSLLFGSIIGLNQIKIKSLLAYSGILNIGYVLITLLNINTNLNLTSFFLFIIQYTITHINIFLIILLLPSFLLYNNKILINSLNNNNNNSNNNNNNNNNNSNNNIIKNYINNLWNYNKYYSFKKINQTFYTINNPYSPIEYIGQLSNLGSLQFYLILSLIICLFSLIGIPPLLGFYGKYFILISSLNSGFYFITFILILASIISTIYYSYIIKILILPKSNNNIINNINKKELINYNKTINNINNINNNDINNIKIENIKLKRIGINKKESNTIIISYIISVLTLIILLNILVIDKIIELLLI